MMKAVIKLMKKRNILMCLQQLDIGGVETAVLTLCKGYIRAGHNVFVAAKPGIYSEQLKKLGATLLPIEYKIENKYALDKFDELVDFCKKNKITEVHIHQYPCVAYWLPVIMKLKIPYVAYVHSIIPGAPEWFMSTFPIYKTAIPIFFENASKIVCIAESTKNDIENLFHLGDDRYLIIPNSLNFQDFTVTRKYKKIENFGLIARLSEEKMKSIEKAIQIFDSYSTKHKDCKMYIAGDGPEKKNVEELAKKYNNIELVGSIDDIPKFMNNIDIYMGVDRTILEALACKRISIITSYEGNAIFINSDNIEKASKQNFSGNNFDKDDNILDELESITKEEYQKITDKNYEYINKKYNVDNNLYNDILVSNYTNDYEYIFNLINDMTNDLEYMRQELNNKKEITLIKKGKRVLRKIINKVRNKQ